MEPRHRVYRFRHHQFAVAHGDLAEISVGAFAYLYGPDMDAYGVFTGCVTDGSNPGLPAVESSLNEGAGQPVVIRNGLESITFEADAQNCMAYFVVNLFFGRRLTEEVFSLGVILCLDLDSQMAMNYR